MSQLIAASNLSKESVVRWLTNVRLVIRWWKLHTDSVLSSEHMHWTLGTLRSPSISPCSSLWFDRLARLHINLTAESRQRIRFLFFISSKKVDFCSFCLHIWLSRSLDCVNSSLSRHIPPHCTRPLVFVVGVRSDGAVAVGSEYLWGWSALSTPADSTAQCPETRPTCPWYA